MIFRKHSTRFLTRATYFFKDVNIFLGSEGGSEQTRPLKSSSQEPSEPSTPDFDPISDKHPPPPPQFDTKDHIIQIEEPESPSRTLYITKEEDCSLQKPISPTTSERPQSEQILSASALDSQYRQMTKDPELGIPEATSSKVSVESPAISESTSRTPKPSFTLTAPSPSHIASSPTTPRHTSSPRPSGVSPSVSPSMSTKTDKGKSKVTGKVVSGWL